MKTFVNRSNSPIEVRAGASLSRQAILRFFATLGIVYVLIIGTAFAQQTDRTRGRAEIITCYEVQWINEGTWERYGHTLHESREEAEKEVRWLRGLGHKARLREISCRRRYTPSERMPPRPPADPPPQAPVVRPGGPGKPSRTPLTPIRGKIVVKVYRWTGDMWVESPIDRLETGDDYRLAKDYYLDTMRKPGYRATWNAPGWPAPVISSR